MPILDFLPFERLIGEAHTVHDEEAAKTYQEMLKVHEEAA
jgi:hypothetical protein